MSTETVLRSSGVYNTILGALNQFQAFTDLSYTAMRETTLNTKYGVLNNYNNGEPLVTPALKYFGIGTKGFRNLDLMQTSMPYPGDSRQMDLYEPIPFRCVPVSEESLLITPQDKQKYRMRCVRSFGGIDYACYYLKLISFNNTIEIMERDADGREVPYTLNPSAWLSPTPPELREDGGVIDTNTNRVVVRASGICEVTHEELAEAVSAIYNGDSAYYRVSEFGYYTGYDVPVDSSRHAIEYDDNGKPLQTVDAQEAAYVQLAKGHNFRGSDLSTGGSYMRPRVFFESECCITDNTL